MLNFNYLIDSNAVNETWKYLTEGISSTREMRYFAGNPDFKKELSHFLFTCEVLSCVDRPALDLNGRIINVSDYVVPAGVQKLSSIRTYYGSDESVSMNKPMDSLAVSNVEVLTQIVEEERQKRDKYGHNLVEDDGETPVMERVKVTRYKTILHFRFPSFEKDSEFDFKFMEPGQFNGYYDMIEKANPVWALNRSNLNVKDCFRLITEFGAFLSDDELEFFQFGNDGLDEYYSLLRGVKSPFNYPSRHHLSPEIREVLDWYFGMGVDVRFGSPTMSVDSKEGKEDGTEKTTA